MSRDAWNALLTEARATHSTHPELSSFCPFPVDVRPSPVAGHRIGASDLMEQDSGLASHTYGRFRDCFIACSPHADWRETYRDTSIGEDFLNRFGCYELIGFEGAFSSSQMRSFVVYAPAGLHYPWHHHPAEELYLVIAGEAEFHLHGEPSRILRPGDTAFHSAHTPHAMTTHDKPVMAYVLWRGDLHTSPRLCEAVLPILPTLSHAHHRRPT